MMENEIKEYKVIHAHVFDPRHTFFKSSANEKSECSVASCCNSERCGLFKRKECCLVGGSLFRESCPYGKRSTHAGYSRRASKFYDWIKEQEAQYSNVLNALSSVSKVMSLVGEYVYLPYSFITMNESVPFTQRENFFSKGNRFLPVAHFTIENIEYICNFHPMAMMGGEITSYQKEEVPKFVKHLSEQFPELYAELCKKLPRVNEISLTNVGREAYLRTLNTNVGEFIDCHKSHWVWDGEYLISKDSKASFMLVDKFAEIRIKPNGDPTVKITDDKQVNGKTEYFKS